MLAPHDSAVLTHRSSTSPCLVGYRAPRSCMVVMPTAARAPTMHATCGRRKEHRQMRLPLHPQAVRHRCWSCPSTGSSRTCRGASREGSGAGPPHGTVVWGRVLARDRASCVWNADLWWAGTIIPVLLTQERNPVKLGRLQFCNPGLRQRIARMDPCVATDACAVLPGGRSREI